MDKTEIEQYIDKHGLEKLLEMVEEICREKAQHVIEVWDDKELRRGWVQSANRIERCITQLSKIDRGGM